VKAFDFDCVVATAIAILLILCMHLYDKTKELQTQIDELTIITNERFLPALIFDKYNLELR
jgi:hypothetical protein